MNTSKEWVPRCCLWADTDDSWSGTEETSVSGDSPCHPEAQNLLQKAANRLLPLKIYLSNLPYGNSNLAPLTKTWELAAEEQTHVILTPAFTNNRFLGKATAIISNKDIALKVLRCHGTLFEERPVYMNLDGNFARGKKFLSTFGDTTNKKDRFKPWWAKKHKNTRQSGKKSAN